jgi:hypothetical protein
MVSILAVGTLLKDYLPHQAQKDLLRAGKING